MLFCTAAVVDPRARRPPPLTSLAPAFQIRAPIGATNPISLAALPLIRSRHEAPRSVGSALFRPLLSSSPPAPIPTNASRRGPAAPAHASENASSRLCSLPVRASRPPPRSPPSCSSSSPQMAEAGLFPVFWPTPATKPGSGPRSKMQKMATSHWVRPARISRRHHHPKRQPRASRHRVRKGNRLGGRPRT